MMSKWLAARLEIWVCIWTYTGSIYLLDAKEACINGIFTSQSNGAKSRGLEILFHLSSFLYHEYTAHLFFLIPILAILAQRER